MDMAESPASGSAASGASTAWHALSAEEALAHQKVETATGLSAAEVASRRSTYGPNKLSEAAREPRWRAFLRQYKDPMQVVLLAAGVVSLFLPGQFWTGVGLILLTVFNAVIGLNQEGKAESSVAALQKMMVITARVLRDGEIAWSGVSGRARDGRTPLTEQTPFVIGSVTKTFVAATILQLVEEGLLELDDPVRRHLPRLTMVGTEITVRQLLDHTSGLADLFNDATRRGIEEHPELAWSADEVLATLHEPWYDPGEGWAYANTNYFLLGMIVERVTGATLAEELQRPFFGPLGLGTTRVLDGRAGDPLQPAWTTIFWASGAMSSSATDIARWGDALYDGDLLSARARREMLLVNEDDYGLGAQRIELDAETAGYGHTGLLNTYTTLLLHLPREDVTLALLVNRTDVDLAAALAARPPGGASLLELARGG